MSEVSALIKGRRKIAGISQKKLGKQCGISDSEIMKIENGVRKTPSWENLCKIAKALNVHPFEFLYAAGYISEHDIQPYTRLNNLEKLNSSEMNFLQMLIDFMIAKKNSQGGV